MSRPRSTGVAVDTDSTWCAWTTESGSVQVLNLLDDALDEIIDAGPGNTVHAGAGTGRFLIQDGRTLRAWSPETGAEEKGTVDLDALLLEYPHDGSTAIVAATETSLDLLSGPGPGWSHRLQAPPLVLAWQRRRHGILCVLSDGSVHKVDPSTGRATTSHLVAEDELLLSCYDEVLGGVWTVSASAPKEARFHRLETDPPKRIYRKELAVAPESIGTSHSGEWLIVQAPGTRPTLLFNVNSDRDFDIPGELASRGAPCVFSYDNRLVSVEEDVIETLLVPARADVRSRDGSLDIDAFWSAPPRMHRAARGTKRSATVRKGG